MENFTLDDIEYDATQISEAAREQLRNLEFVNEQILQRNNELQVAQTAKIGYSRALARELKKLPD